MECIGWCEFDKFAQKSYRAMYDTERLWFADDIRKVRGWDVPKADLWTFGFPCQDVSIAGKQKGENHMEQIGIGMFLVGLAGILIIMGKWVYECQGMEITTLYILEVMMIIGIILTTGGNC